MSCEPDLVLGHLFYNHVIAANHAHGWAGPVELVAGGVVGEGLDVDSVASQLHAVTVGTAWPHHHTSDTAVHCEQQLRRFSPALQCLPSTV